MKKSHGYSIPCEKHGTEKEQILIPCEEIGDDSLPYLGKSNTVRKRVF